MTYKEKKEKLVKEKDELLEKYNDLYKNISGL